MLRLVSLLVTLLAAVGCASSPDQYRDFRSSPSPANAPSNAPASAARAPVEIRRLIASSSDHQKVGRPYTVSGQRYVPRRDDRYDETGIASWYGPNFHGRPTANGEVFDQNLMTAAHPTLPIPSIVEVTNLENGRQVILRLNDRGPFVDDRMIDLSRAAATQLDYLGRGLARVRVRYLGPAEPAAAPPARQFHMASNSRGRHDAPQDMNPAANDFAFSSRPAVPTTVEPLATNLAAVSPPAVEVTDLGELRDAQPVSSRQAQSAAQERVDRLPAPAGSRVTVQLGAFSDPANADRVAQRLAGMADVRIVQGSSNGRPIWRVFAGEFDSPAAAQSLQSNLARLGIAESRVVPIS